MNRYKHKENGEIYIVIKTEHLDGLDIIIYQKENQSRVYCRDMYMFLKNMEMIED